MATITIKTENECWVLPECAEVVKVMILSRRLKASRLCFESQRECQHFVRRLSLLALKDECDNQSPSIIADFSRKIVQRNFNYPN